MYRESNAYHALKIIVALFEHVYESPFPLLQKPPAPLFALEKVVNYQTIIEIGK